MNKLWLLFVVSSIVLLSSAGSVQGGLLSLFKPRTSTTTTTTTERPRRPFFLNNNIPKIDDGCEAHFECKKKLTQLPLPRPCVKYCLKRIDCPNNVKVRGKANQCVELDEEQVLEELDTSHKASVYNSASGVPTTESIMQVAMIDFPCQPGYLPDSRGRCREVW